MDIPFYKYQGTGNDFIVIDNRKMWFPSDDITLIKAMCDRRFGIGSDGLILIEPDEATDFYMNFYNPDGSQSYCGNGSRCALHFARSLKMVNGECLFRAIDGEHKGNFENDRVFVSIRPVLEILRKGEDFFIDTGSPHYIRFVSDINSIDLIAEAHKIRYSDQYRQKGVNVNFVDVEDDHIIQMRTYERGVEDETLSCGTGVTAAALAHMTREGFSRTVTVETRGGTLKVSATPGGQENSFFNIWLSGPAVQTFSGTYHTN